MTREALQQLRELLQEQSKGLTIWLFQKSLQTIIIKAKQKLR